MPAPSLADLFDGFVNDGALIPGSAGAVKPALTIAVPAERDMSRVLDTRRPMDTLRKG